MRNPKEVEIKVGSKDRAVYVLAAQRAFTTSSTIAILARGEKNVGKALTIGAMLNDIPIYEINDISVWREQHQQNGRNRMVTCVRIIVKRRD